jgi:tRNA(fMet)-specific endonuclease VapC
VTTDLYVLDSDILSLYQRGHAGVCERVERHDLDDLAVTIISIEEQLSGWYTARRRTTGKEQLARIYERFAQSVRLLARMQILSFTEQAIDQYERLRRMKLRVRSNDLRIAAITLVNDAVVVTRNRIDFAQIPELRIEDWSA